MTKAAPMTMVTRRKVPGSLLVGLLAPVALLAAERPAAACGCFAQPNPVQRVVQAGERVIFAVRDDEVQMHVQVAFSGDATSFGWLLPVPAIPELTLGSDALFEQLDRQLAPRFFLNQDFSNDCVDFSSGFGCSDEMAAIAAPDDGRRSFPREPLIIRRDIGAFDAAILEAENADAMFDWLNDNEFVVPVGPESDVIRRYLGAGRYFVALKLQASRTVGDIQPIVLTFPGGSAMIPITLTQVGATADMPVVVHVFADHRAIPRNYQHTELNPEHIDWFDFGSNYGDVVTRAVDEAEGAHSFVTEAAVTDAGTGFSVDTSYDLGRIGAAETARELLQVIGFDRHRQSPKLQNLLRAFVPHPEEARAEGISEEEYYEDLFRFTRAQRRTAQG